MSDSFQPYGLQSTRLLCQWNFPGKNTGEDYHFLLWGSSQPRDQICISYIAGSLLHWGLTCCDSWGRKDSGMSDNFGFQTKQPFQIRYKIIYSSHWVFIKAHLIFRFSVSEFASHLTKVFSRAGWSSRSFMFSEQNVILHRKHQTNTALSFGWSLLKCFVLC